MSSENNNNPAAIFQCERHPDEQARLTCGGCGKRICTICLTLIGEGVRCPACMARLNAAYAEANNDRGEYKDFSRSPARPKSVVTPPGSASFNPRFAGQSYRASGPANRVEVGPDGKIKERDTGFRTYWKRTPPRYLIQPQYYLVAVVAALVAAVVTGVVWGYLLAATATAGSVQTLAAAAYRNSLQLWPEIIMGVIVAEAVARVTRDRRGAGLQTIAAVGVVLGYLVALATLIARIYLNSGVALPPVGTLVSDTWNAINYLSRGGLAIFAFWAVGVGLAIFRLKR